MPKDFTNRPFDKLKKAARTTAAASTRTPAAAGSGLKTPYGG